MVVTIPVDGARNFIQVPNHREYELLARSKKKFS